MHMTPFVVIAHRGFSSKAPENTFEAFNLALASGFNHIETDCLLSRDGVALVLHDEKLGRNNNGSGSACDYTAEQLQSLDAGSWFGILLYDSMEIGRGSHIISCCKSQVDVWPKELKSQQPDLAARVVEALTAANWLGSTAQQADTAADPFGVPGLTITSFHLEQLQKSQQLMPDVPHGWLVQEIDDAVLGVALQSRLRQLCPRADCCSAERVLAARQAGLSVRGWGVKNVQLLHHIVACGAQGATVDWPDEGRAALEQGSC